MGAVAVFELLWLGGQSWGSFVLQQGRRTGVRPKMICGDLPERALARSSSTMSWVISTCMAGGEGELGLAWACGAPQRAMPP
jgi:hypothetical protein